MKVEWNMMTAQNKPGAMDKTGAMNRMGTMNKTGVMNAEEVCKKQNSKSYKKSGSYPEDWVYRNSGRSSSMGMTWYIAKDTQSTEQQSDNCKSGIQASQAIGTSASSNSAKKVCNKVKSPCKSSHNTPSCTHQDTLKPREEYMTSDTPQDNPDHTLRSRTPETTQQLDICEAYRLVGKEYRQLYLQSPCKLRWVIEMASYPSRIGTHLQLLVSSIGI